MRDLSHPRLRQQVCFLRRQFLQEGDLPFTDVLSEKTIAPALDAIEASWNDRIYSPLVTLWVFLSQVMSADHSCRAAVARLIAHRLSRGLAACSPRTGAYCQARERLPETFFSAVTRLVGRALESRVDPKWLWKGRRVYMFDGTIVSMPDTAENQRAYPQPYNQKPGLGFPIARIGAITSLACGAIVNLGFSRYAGKGQGEVTLLRQLASVFSAGDVLLADCLMCNWRNLYTLQQRGVDMVTRLNKALRSADFRKGERLGKDDHLVRWPKPHIRGVGRAAQRAMARSVTVREVRVFIRQPGFRTKVIIIVTTLLDPVQYTKEDLAALYRQRWHNELDLRSLKTTLQMDVLRCKTPELVRKEVWTHILVSNLIRTVMAQSASRHGIAPRSISFKGSLQTLEAFGPLLDFQGDRSAGFRSHLYHQLLDAIACHRVADRPDRFEPRFKKRRSALYRSLNVPRPQAKLAMQKGHTKI